MKTLALTLALIAAALIGGSTEAALHHPAAATTTTAPAVKWLCVEGLTYLQFGQTSLTRVPDRDSMCKVAK